MGVKKFTKDVLILDVKKEVQKISDQLLHLAVNVFKRRGLIVALSGGIDSSVTLALAVKALGKKKVIALLMPERHSSEDTIGLSTKVADHFGVEKVYKDITGILEALAVYKKYEAAVRMVIPEYDDTWKSKIVTPNIVEKRSFILFSVVAQSPDGKIVKKRLPLKAYLEIVAATNFKQRSRKMLEYYYADRHNYAVAGTPNRLEYDQGFFVKLGDGAADVKPIAHLYKSQVYQLANYLGVPEDVRRRLPTTDTYSLSQGQDEFYFSLPYDKMDLCLYGKNNRIPTEMVADATGLTLEQVQRVYDDIDLKRSTTRYLHLPPLLVENVPEVKN